MKLIRQILLLVVFFVPVVHAQKIAVVDSEMAVLESDSAIQYAKDVEKLFAPRLKKLQALQEEIQGLEEKLKKDSSTLSESEVENRRLEIKRKIEDLQLQDRQLRADKGRSDQAELMKMKPKLDKAVEELAKELDFDMVLERGAVRYVKSEYDLTRKVIERLNKMK